MAEPPTPNGRTSAQLGGASSDLYQRITRQVTDLLEKGVVPWRSPILGQTKIGWPRNLNTGKHYRGVNVFTLAFTAYLKGYESGYWLTYRQAQERGGQVRRGEQSTPVVFWKPLEVKDPKTGEKKKAFVLRCYNAFNVEQCDGVERPDQAAYTPTKFTPVEAAERIIEAYGDAPVVEHGGSRAYYRPLEDVVRLPEPSRFRSTEEYYATKFHELAHSTGHSKRLDRKLDTQLAPFGSSDYSREELCAEMTAAFLCAESGIAPAVIENQAAYLKGWLGRLKEDSKLIVFAAGAAQRAADWIKGVKPNAFDDHAGAAPAGPEQPAEEEAAPPANP